LLSAVGTVQANLTVALVTAAVGITRSTQSPVTALRAAWITSSSRCCSASARASSRSSGATSARAVPSTLAHRVDRRRDGGRYNGRHRLARRRVRAAVGRAFTTDPAVIAITTLYLRTVAPFYAVFGIGMTLYFADKVHDASAGRSSPAPLVSSWPACWASLRQRGSNGLSPACSRWSPHPRYCSAPSSSAY
jgi:hypothetical protein